VLSVEDWARIRHLSRVEKMPVKAIARTMGCSKNTVKKALAADVPPKYQRQARGSVVDAVEPQIRGLLAEYPTMPATVIAERIGWTYSIRLLRDRVAELRPVYLPPDPASRTTYVAGEIAQCDFWFPDIELPVGFGQTRTAKQLPVLVMVCGYSRWLTARLVPTRTGEDLFAGWWALISELGAAPRTLVWDGEGAVGRWRRGHSELTADTHAFRGVLGSKGADLQARRPRGQGHDRAGQRLPGDLVSARPQLHRPRRLQHPAGRLAGVGQWPPQAGAGLRPCRTGGGGQGRDAVAAAGGSGDRLGTVAAATQGSLRAAGLQRLLGAPGRGRCWARHQTIHDPAHLQAAQMLRRERLTVVPPAQTTVEQRNLSDYDHVFGLDQGAL
jgi:transposase